MVMTDRPVIMLGHGIVFVNPMKKAKKKKVTLLPFKKNILTG
jgi:hypothetical protein